MQVEVKDLDGQRSVFVEVTEELPGSLFIFSDRFAHEFDLAIFTRAVERAAQSEHV